MTTKIVTAPITCTTNEVGELMHRLVERAFGKSLHEQAVYLPGVLSRKKQVVPLISNAV